jgi:spermidine/putrescine transport system permease protein
MAAFSFRPAIRGDLFQLWTPTLDQYASLAATGSYWRLLGISSLTALGIGISAVVLAFPLAYFLALRAGPRAGFYLILLLVPFWTSYLLRVMAWKILLGTEGVLNSFLIYIGFIHEPLPALLYNRTAVIVTLIYVWFPFAALPILAALQRIDPVLFEAAADLGARPFHQFTRITLPLSLPGVIAAFFMVFIPTVGEYVTPFHPGFLHQGCQLAARFGAFHGHAGRNDAARRAGRAPDRPETIIRMRIGFNSKRRGEMG